MTTELNRCEMCKKLVGDLMPTKNDMEVCEDCYQELYPWEFDIKCSSCQINEPSFNRKICHGCYFLKKIGVIK